MPLTMARGGESFVIKKISGKEEVRRHLESLGFVAGAGVAVISDIGGNLIVNIKESRVALDKSLAARIYV
jgi:ferrous iron transport protein A